MTMPTQVESVVTRLGLHMANRYTEFEVYNLSRSGDIS